MGADFIFEVVEAGRPIQYWQQILGELDDGQVQEFAKMPSLDYLWDEMTEQQIVERIDEAFKVVYNSDSREIGWFNDEDKRWVITGGMSWGDDPTDCYRDFEIAAEFQRFAGTRGLVPDLK